mgnify:CR=1 FL=1
MKINRIEHMCEGNGHVIIKELLDEQQLNGKCGLYAEVTLEPGCSLGYHEHHGESETYYILSGKGIYSDNGELRMVEAGDMTFTPDGKGHALTARMERMEREVWVARGARGERAARPGKSPESA